MTQHQKKGKTARSSLSRVNLSSPLVKGGVVAVDVFVIGPLLDTTQAISKSLIVNDLTLPQEFDRIAHIRVIRQPQNVVVGHASLLLWGIDPGTTIQQDLSLFWSKIVKIASKFQFCLISSLLRAER